ncbi:MAG TPA: hemerythrin domain-containing protein [Streptosporangiaceae bacterium]|nr:hemerythrin domain-containing protein [Streptosporangiaceae bacterium]
MASDAITMLKAEHRDIRRLFREFRRTTDRAVKTRAKLVGQIIELLTVHTYVENEVLYPSVRELLPELEEEMLESYEEHHVADVLCVELAAMSPDNDHFEAKTVVLIETVSHHIQEEEGERFPKIRAGLSRTQLLQLGAMVEQARRQAPTSPAQPSAVKKVVDAVIS